MMAGEEEWSSPEQEGALEERRLHLQTILLVAQLNAAYFEMHLSLQKAFAPLERRQRNNKLAAFFRIATHRCNHYRLNRTDSLLTRNDFQRIAFLSTVRAVRVLASKIDKKRASLLCSSFYHILAYCKESSLLRNSSDKPSRIETTESRKSEAYCSRERREYRRLYSREKRASNGKEEREENVEKEKEGEEKGRELSRLLQRNMEGERKHRSIGRRKEKTGEKKEKMAELEFLQRKYSKLMSEFAQFSSKFLQALESK